MRLVLECDGTQVEDGEYFRTLANNSVLLLLRQGERWYPAGVDVIKAGKKLKYCDEILSDLENFVLQQYQRYQR